MLRRCRKLQLRKGLSQLRHDHCLGMHPLKHAVLQTSGSTDETEEATFCQGLKSRIKKKWIARIDDFIATTNKGDGYRLRARVEPYFCGQVGYVAPSRPLSTSV